MSEECIENAERITVETDLIAGNLNKVNLLNDILKPRKEQNSVFLILNQKIKLSKRLFELIWDRFQIKICADAGANRLYHYLKSEDDRARYVPNYIIGDFDSIDEAVKDFYLKHGCVAIKQTTQYSTDFSKSINLMSLHFNSRKFHAMLNKKLENFGIPLESGIHELYDAIPVEEKSSINVLAIGAIGGRFDQTIHSISQLYTLKHSDPYFNLYYLTENDIIVLLLGGANVIEYDMGFRNECVGNCGILPIGEPTTIIESHGLKWDVKNWDTSISTGKVSSSNRFVGIDRCYVNVKDDMIMNIEVDLIKLQKYIE
ncbi:hypothetical protein KAFR_0E02510 [Kazachstania africana CBS 2517]|uniref:Thiamine pyrophosphokinase n=1 Tax=Kazachstania africana (strain ATCC 22294 / BCRC 22015 / CBS 2517 / CECT 1963 / NBRC 1671 / NRRL Y-8276) TaxID=1071382 RepID=H2AVK4_KAZAF|nr:hypothetical protein KAFR_0E02510 [Kazachstania africana CBS 2517]CCF58404.1 hypothetical protein KAFR_0E02510 [Kazachstania africana CBS 2517]